MNTVLRRFMAATACAVAVVVAMPLNAIAQDVPQATVAILDYQRILRESSAAVDIKSQIEKQRQLYQDEITEQEKKLRAADEELARQRTILSSEAFAQKRRKFEERVAKVQRNVQERKRELDEAYEHGIKRIQKELATIIAELAKERGFNLVLSRRQIVFAANSMNISDEVLLRLNQRLPSVDVPLAQED